MTPNPALDDALTDARIAEDRADTAEAELAALKARRCDGCAHWSVDEQPSGWGVCRNTHSASGPMLGMALLTATDHACNAWQAREAQP